MENNSMLTNKITEESRHLETLFELKPIEAKQQASGEAGIPLVANEPAATRAPSTGKGKKSQQPAEAKIYKEKTVSIYGKLHSQARKAIVNEDLDINMKTLVNRSLEHYLNHILPKKKN